MRSANWMLAWTVALVVGCDQSSPVVDTPPSPADSEVVSNAPIAEAKPAQVGVGVQGQSLKEETGIGKLIAQPALTFFQTKEKVVFEIQIPQAMEIYRATDGEYPATHEDFMAKIIKANKIQLPKLPAGQEYRYRPEEHQLWVEPKAGP
jgi:hypothetical protein